jgi:glyoxylase-like metal-dependent hydrolase (beta-lactamase superfamily II)
MDAFICRTCGVQHAASEFPPGECAICLDERQYVGWDGQTWARLPDLAAEGFRTVVRDEEPSLTGIGVEPSFGIGQRALMVRTPGGNVLWDVPGFLDDAALGAVRRQGGLAGISASHPHFYGVMVEWSQAFGGVPILLPKADRPWVRRPDPAIRFYDERAEVVPGVTLVRCGGHFEGSAVLHWRDGAAGAGALLTGDSITVAQDRRFMSFMRSYPNLIPLSAGQVRRILAVVEPLEFDRIYGGWWGRVVRTGGKEAVRASAERYISWLTGPPD